jgi:hypothetical protein|tara:strand:+ start:31180 stop:32100 length:921 start_codon:yes stop_codon:yes gene_type:complete
MKVVSYHYGIPPRNNKPEKPAILTNFVQGVKAKGDDGLDHFTSNIIDCDLAVLQGFVHQKSKQAPHLQLRQRVLDTQRLKNKRTLLVDSNLFLYLNKSNQPHHYLRYSFDGVFRKTGFYFDKDIDPGRWQTLKRDLNIDIKDYRTQGNHILICLQRNGGWSMKGMDVMQFCNSVITQVKKHTDRPIVVRGHPGDGKTNQYLKLDIPGVTVSNKDIPIQEDLKNAWATVLFNSSPGVASLIEGVPVFQMDPDKEYSMYSEVANSNLKRLEDPKLFARQEWLERIAMCHWSFDQTASGEAWEFMRQYV